MFNLSKWLYALNLCSDVKTSIVYIWWGFWNGGGFWSWQSRKNSWGVFGAKTKGDFTKAQEQDHEQEVGHQMMGFGSDRSLDLTAEK